MKTGPEHKPEFESLKDLLLDMALERSVDALLDMIVRRLAERSHVALARIWLIGPGDICPVCPMRSECTDQTKCLHLVASAGSPLDNKGEDWFRLDGDFRRFPLGIRKVGTIGATHERAEIVDIKEDSEWIVRPDWVRREGILGYAGQPLLHKGERLGVLAIFSRIRLLREGIFWMRMIANHAGISIVNARAFGEIAHLKKQLELENIYLREELDGVQAFGDIIGQGPAFKNLMKQIELVAPTDASVLISGESGTGKELVAREIHKLSRRRDNPMIKVNCASIPHELYESEFFGHVKGAFTGAVKDRAGRFEAANGGTLFLDEVGEIPLELQSKLLRVLQEGQYERVGEEATRQVDVRIIASTNRDLKEEVEMKRFRQDLYYRINVFPIEAASLRRRKEDIPLLADHFLNIIAKKMNCFPPRLTQANLLDLHGYDWPGNVRELQNIIERAIITSRCSGLRFDLPSDLISDRSLNKATISPGAEAGIEFVPDAKMQQRERDNTIAALRMSVWKIYGQGGAAELLGVKPTTLSARIKKIGIKKPDK
ncbi:MAG: sigma 54-interacting transcriptional regulator [Deltaproteobacteria bacterium]|nr:sigma 54-interacting transcriptional regulator [Deltaproteobacteria bacterium]